MADKITITTGLYKEILDFMREEAKNNEVALAIMNRYDDRLKLQHQKLKR